MRNASLPNDSSPYYHHHRQQSVKFSAADELSSPTPTSSLDSSEVVAGTITHSSGGCDANDENYDSFYDETVVGVGVSSENENEAAALSRKFSTCSSNTTSTKLGVSKTSLLSIDIEKINK